MSIPATPLGAIVFLLFGVATANPPGSDTRTAPQTLSDPIEIVSDGFFRRTPPLLRQPASLPGAAQSPNAVRHVGAHDRTYIVYGDQNCDPMVIAFDHDSRQWFGSIRVGATPRRRDVHSLPAIAVSPAGHICVFFGGHATPILMVRSQEPESIEAWSEPIAITERGTYWSPYTAVGAMWLLHRDRSHWGSDSESKNELRDTWGFRTSVDDGLTWSALTPLFALPRHTHPYPAWIVQPGDPMVDHVFWLNYSLIDGWRDMRYMRSTDGGVRWTDSHGRPLEVPLGSVDAGELVFEGATQGFQNEIVVDAAGRPALLFVTGGREIVDNNRALVAYDLADAWRVSEVCEATSRYNRGTMITNATGHLRVFFASGAIEGGTISVWETHDHGSTWTKIGELETPGSAASPVRVHGARPELQVLWCGGADGRSIYAWGESGTLTAP